MNKENNQACSSVEPSEREIIPRSGPRQKISHGRSFVPHYFSNSTRPKRSASEWSRHWDGNRVCQARFIKGSSCTHLSPPTSDPTRWLPLTGCGSNSQHERALKTSKTCPVCYFGESLLTGGGRYAVSVLCQLFLGPHKVTFGAAGAFVARWITSLDGSRYIITPDKWWCDSE